jgi:acetyl-CoA carboxylase beta subunit
VGRGDGTDCPNGEDAVVDGIRCEECRHHWELDATERGRRLVVDDGLTRPMGDPDEAGHRGSAA